MYFNIENCSKNFGKLICLGSGAEFDPKHYIPNMKENYFGKYIPVKSDIYSFSKYQIAKDIESKKKIFIILDFLLFLENMKIIEEGLYRIIFADFYVG